MKPLPRKAYTDSPELHPNLFIAAFQLQWWLYFHPSAWHNFISRVEPGLRSNFSLLELQPSHLRNSALKRLLLATFLIWPLISALITAVIKYTQGIDGHLIVRQSLLAFSYCLASGFIASLAHSVALGIGYSVILGLGVSLPVLLSKLVTGIMMAASLGGYVAAITAPRFSSRSMQKQIIGILTSIAGITALIISGHGVVSGSISGNQQHVQAGDAISLQSSITFAVGGGILYAVIYFVAIFLRTSRLSLALKTGGIFLLIGGVGYAGSLSLPRENPLISIFAGTAGSLLFVGLFVLAFSLAERLVQSQT